MRACNKFTIGSVQALVHSIFMSELKNIKILRCRQVGHVIGKITFEVHYWVLFPLFFYKNEVCCKLLIITIFLLNLTFFNSIEKLLAIYWQFNFTKNIGRIICKVGHK